MPREHSTQNAPVRRIDHEAAGCGAEVMMKTAEGTISGTFDGFDFDGDTCAAVVSFGAGEWPGIAMASDVELTLEGPSDTIVQLRGIVVAESRRDTRDAVVVHLTGPLPARLVHQTNRRQAFRVRPSVGHPVGVRIRVAHKTEPIEVELQDISVLGLSMLMSTQTERDLVGQRQLSVDLLLPGERDPIPVQARIRHRAVRGDRVRYGVEFGAEATPEFETSRANLTHYVMHRQRTGLRTRQEAS